MKKEIMNLNNINKLKIEQNKESREIFELIQKVGKSKRRHQITLSRTNKKIIYKIMKEISSTLSFQKLNSKNFENFLNHLEIEAKSGKILRLSYEELTLLRKVILISIKNLENSHPKWYQLIRRFYIKIILAQYRNLLKVLNI